MIKCKNLSFAVNYIENFRPETEEAKTYDMILAKRSLFLNNIDIDIESVKKYIIVFAGLLTAAADRDGVNIGQRDLKDEMERIEYCIHNQNNDEAALKKAYIDTMICLVNIIEYIEENR